jgi:hypothetical protein
VLSDPWSDAKERWMQVTSVSAHAPSHPGSSALAFGSLRDFDDVVLRSAGDQVARKQKLFNTQARALQ